MRYTGLKKNASDEKTRMVCEFGLGINDDAGELSTDKSVLADCVNMHFEKGRLLTRPGFSANQNGIIAPEEYDIFTYLPFTVTDTTYFKNSKEYKLAFSCIGYVSSANFKIHLVDSEGNITPAGIIYFPRASSEQFYIPAKAFFAVAESINGIGVFAFITRLNYGENPIYEIYEAQENFSDWTNVSSYCYVPTVRINGKGERYDQARGYSDLNYPDPERPEELNLLNGRFKCYFTSDGLSAYFRLPYGNLDDYRNVLCRYYSAPDTYVEWNIPPLSSTKSIQIDGVTVTLAVDRTLGILHFHKNPDDYCVPLTPRCKLNNIMVIASTIGEEIAGQIAGSSGCVMLGSHLYFYGNDVRQNCIHCAKIKNPLYVPQSAKLFLGDSSSPVTALRVQNGKLIAFKPGETYRVITSEAGEQKEKEATLPESSLYVTGDKLSAQTIDTAVGCAHPKTIKLCGSRLVWLSPDGTVRALATTTYGNTTNVYRVSAPIAERLKSAIDTPGANAPFAVTQDGKYILIAGGSAFVMNYTVRGFGYSKAYYALDDESKSPAWYIWRLPQSADYISGAQVGGNAVLVSDFGSGLYFNTSVISGQCDSVIVMEDGETTTENLPISSGFTTKRFDFGVPQKLKRIEAMYINGKGSDYVSLKLFDRNRKVTRKVRPDNTMSPIRIGSALPACLGAAAELSCDKPFSVGSIIFKYKLLSDKG